MNYRLLAFLLLCLSLFYYYKDRSRGTELTGKTSRLNHLREWERRAFCFRRFNPLIYTKFTIRLRKYKEYIRSIEQLKWHKLVRHKRLLPDITTEIVNLFHSMIHSIPLNRVEEFNQMLRELHGLLQVIARNTIQEFYDNCPQIRDRDLDYDVNITKDWYIHEYFNPKGYDPTINFHYDFYV